MSTSRHVARIVSMQTVFEWEFRGTDIEEIFNRNVETHQDRLEDSSYAGSIVNGVMQNYKDIQDKIGEVAPEWPIDQISPVDRAVLYSAIYEIEYLRDESVPPIVAVNEAIEIAKNFGGNNSGKFVNGALGTIIRRLEADGIITLDKKEEAELEEMIEKNDSQDEQEVEVEATQEVHSPDSDIEDDLDKEVQVESVEEVESPDSDTEDDLDKEVTQD